MARCNVLITDFRSQVLVTLAFFCQTFLRQTIILTFGLRPDMTLIAHAGVHFKPLPFLPVLGRLDSVRRIEVPYGVTEYSYELGHLVTSCGKAHHAPHDAS